MKPLPKFILLGVVVAGIGYGINTFLDSRKSATPEPVVATQSAPAATSAVVPTVVSAPVEVVSAPPPVSTPALASTDSGLDSVLKAAASKKK